MMSLKRNAFWFIVLGLFSTTSFSIEKAPSWQEQNSEKYFEISEITKTTESSESNTKIVSTQEFYRTSIEAQGGALRLPPPVQPPTPTPNNPANPFPGTNPLPGPNIPTPTNGIDPIGDIISIGRQIWDFIVENSAVANYEEITLSALPADIQNPRDLSNWKRPHTITETVSFKNLFNVEVVRMKYKVIYTPGGQFRGRGAYLANVSIHPVETHVSWGFRLDAQVKIASPVNVGTEENPVAGLQVLVNWKVKPSAGSAKQGRNVYFVEGDGKWEKIE